MTHDPKADTIRKLFAAFLSQDRATADDILANTFTFTSPYDDSIDKATYFERCWPNSGHIKSHTIEKLFVEGDEAFVLYHIATDDGKEFRNTEFFTFSGEQISSVTVYFGATYKDGAFVSAALE
jgi:ketosteroid isomerase-like protein